MDKDDTSRREGIRRVQLSDCTNYGNLVELGMPTSYPFTSSVKEPKDAKNQIVNYVLMDDGQEFPFRTFPRTIPQYLKETEASLLRLIAELPNIGQKGLVYIGRSLKVSFGLKTNKPITEDVVLDVCMLVPGQTGLVLTLSKSILKSKDTKAYNLFLTKELITTMKGFTDEHFTLLSGVISESDLESEELFKEAVKDIKDRGSKFAMPESLSMGDKKCRHLTDALIASAATRTAHVKSSNANDGLSLLCKEHFCVISENIDHSRVLVIGRSEHSMLDITREIINRLTMLGKTLVVTTKRHMAQIQSWKVCSKVSEVSEFHKQPQEDFVNIVALDIEEEMMTDIIHQGHISNVWFFNHENSTQRHHPSMDVMDQVTEQVLGGSDHNLRNNKLAPSLNTKSDEDVLSKKMDVATLYEKNEITPGPLDTLNKESGSSSSKHRIPIELNDWIFERPQYIVASYDGVGRSYTGDNLPSGKQPPNRNDEPSDANISRQLQERTGKEMIGLEELFKDTEVVQKLSTCLADNPVVMLTGPAGEGKTTIGYQVLNRMCSDGFTPFICKVPNEILQIRLRQKVVIMIDDVFGHHNFDRQIAKEWASALHQLDSRSTDIRILLLSRDYILKESRGDTRERTVQLISRFTVFKLYDDHAERKLRKSEFAKHFLQRSVDISTACAIVPQLGYPWIFKMLDTLENANTFSMKFFLPLMQSLTRDEVKKSLFYLMLSEGGRLDVIKLKSNSKLQRKEYEDILADVDLQTPLRTVARCLDNLSETIIKVKGNFATFCHRHVYDSTALAIGQEDPEFIVHHGDDSFLKEHITMEANSQSDMDISVPDFLLDVVLQRLTNLAKSDLLGALKSRLLRNTELIQRMMPVFVDKTFLLARDPPSMKMNVYLISHGGSNVILYNVLSTTELSSELLINAMYGCCEFGNIQGLQGILAKWAEIPIVDCSQFGETPLHVCCRFGHTSIVELLLRNSADSNAVDNEHNTALHISAEAGHTPCVQVLLDDGADVNCQNENGKTALHLAIENGHLEIVDILLPCCSDEIEDKQGKTQFLLACATGNCDIIERILRTNCDVRKVDNDGNSALHLAVESDNSVSVEYLINEFLGTDGFLIDQSNKSGFTPLHLTAKTKSFEVFDILRSSGADVKMSLQNGQQFIHLAALSGNEEFLEKTLRYMPNRKVQDFQKKSPLHLAIEKGHTGIAGRLLKYYTPQEAINERDHGGFSLFKVGCMNGHLGIVNLFIEKCDYHSCAKTCSTNPLITALERGRVDLAMTLIDKENEVKSGTTECSPLPLALRLAAKGGYACVVKALLTAGVSDTRVHRSNKASELRKGNVQNQPYDPPHSLQLSVSAGNEKLHLDDETNVKTFPTVMPQTWNNGTINAVSDSSLSPDPTVQVNSTDPDSSTQINSWSTEAVQQKYLELPQYMQQIPSEPTGKVQPRSTRYREDAGLTSSRSPGGESHNYLDASINIWQNYITNVTCTSEYDRECISALHLAALYGHTEVVEVLLADRSDVNLRTLKNRTALHLAALRLHDTVVERLMFAGSCGDIQKDDFLRKIPKDNPQITWQLNNFHFKDMGKSAQKVPE